MGPSQCGCACAHTASATSLGRRFIDHTITWRVRDIHPLHVGWLVCRSRPQQAERRAAAQLPATRVWHTHRERRASSQLELTRASVTNLPLVGVHAHLLRVCPRVGYITRWADQWSNGATD